MLRRDPRTRTLMMRDYEFPLKDVTDPELYREIFPYNQVPKTPFNHRHVPMIVPEECWITDTTFRDGQQSIAPYTVEQVVELYKMMHALGGADGLIRQSEFFLYSDRDRQAVEQCQELGYDYPEVTGWIRAVKADFKRVKQLGLRETGILTSSSDYHIFLKLRKTRRQAMEMYLDIVKAALDEGIRPRCHFEDVTRADYYGFVLPFALELMRLSAEYDTPVKIRLCDTLGYGVPYPGAMLPRSVPGLCYGLHEYSHVPAEWLEWHGHNDFHKVLINAATAWLYGCSAANGTLLGIGERTGNPPIEGLVVEHASLFGDSRGVDLSVITEIADYYRKHIGIEIPARMPLVGEDFNVTRAGIHADGLSKSEEIYNIFDTATILNSPPKVAITDKSGLAGVKRWIEEHYAVGDLPKNDPRLAAVKDWVDLQYDQDRTSCVSDREMHSLVAEHFPGIERL